MSAPHEYALLGGFSRAKVGRYLALGAAGVSSLAVFLSAGLGIALEDRGMPRQWTAWVASAMSASLVWAALYWLLDNHAWRWPLLSKALSVPDLSGRWQVSGESLDAERNVTHRWAGVLTIAQRWDKLRVRLETDQSASVSITAAILCEEDAGWRLFYTYRNEPWIGEAELHGHKGSADILFAADRRTGAGEYFNGLGRFTFGKLLLTKGV